MYVPLINVAFAGILPGGGSEGLLAVPVRVRGHERHDCGGDARGAVPDAGVPSVFDGPDGVRVPRDSARHLERERLPQLVQQ